MRCQIIYALAQIALDLGFMNLYDIILQIGYGEGCTGG
jgi:hypothetical protein